LKNNNNSVKIMGTGFYLLNLKERNHLEKLDVGVKTILTRTLDTGDGRECTGCTWLRVGMSDYVLEDTAKGFQCP
jgi:hypothetical protein